MVTALLSLLLLLNQASKVFAEIRDRQRQVGELQAMADQQQRAGDFQEAWASLERADRTAGRGSYFARLARSPEAEHLLIRAAQEDLAMAWLERASAAGGSRFSDTVDPLLPTLTRVDTAAGRRKADLCSPTSDGRSALEVARRRRRTNDLGTALPPGHRDGPGNSFAHAHRGRSGWRGNVVAPGRSDGAVRRRIMASGRARPYVRSLQLLRGAANLPVSDE